MALAAISDDFDLDDCGILRDSVTSAELLIDDDGILQDDINVFKHVAGTGGQGTDSGFGGDKQSSTSTIQHLQASFDEDLAPIGDESINISDFEASRDDLDSIGGDLDGHREGKSRFYHKSKNLSLEVDTPGSTLEHPPDFKREVLSQQKLWGKNENRSEDKNLFTDDYYQQLRELGVLVEGADFSKDESFNDESEMLEGQMSQEPGDYDDHRDLIGEYLQEQYDRELAEQEETESHSRVRSYEMSEAQVGRHSRASSAPTISGRSFPEISPEDAGVILSESQQTENEDEIFLINNQLLPASKLKAQKLPVTPSTQGSRPGSRTGSRPGSRTGSRPSSRLSTVGSRSNTPQSIDSRGGGDSLRQTFQNHLQQPSSRQIHSPDTCHHEMPFSHEEQVVSRSETNTPHRRRTDSMTSENMSAASPSKSTISKARSQESFFELDRQQAVSAEKGHKRLLPTPSISDVNESFKIRSKSKSVSNISQRSGPVKPTHMSISEIDRMATEEGGISIGEQSDEMLKKLEGELSTQLKQESVRRKQATELVQQLQKEYDMLLSKYALAELTIDQMRLGARITLHANSPTPISTHAGMVSSGTGAHKGQIMQLAPPPVQKAVVDHFSPTPANTVLLPKSAGAKNSDQHTNSGSQTEKAMTFGSAAIGVGEDSSRPGEPVFRTENRVGNRTSVPPETVKLNLQTRASSLDDRLSHFYTLLEEQHLTLEEQEQVFDNIRTDHDKLRRAYLQAKEDYNVLRRSGASLPNTEFDANKELEGQLFRLGMRFDEIHERVDSNLKEKSMRRHPFQANRHANDDDSDQGNNTDNQDINRGSEQAKDGMQLAVSESETGDEQQFEKRAQFLHDEFKALMDRYRRLKQMSETPEREKETDSLVRKLKDICNEMPDMFRLPPELQKRFKEWKKNERLRLYYQMNSVWERLQIRDQRRSPVLSSMIQQQKQQQQKKTGDIVGGTVPSREIGGSRDMSPVPRGLGTPVMGDHTINAYGLNHGGRDMTGDDNFRRSLSSLAGSHSSMASPRDNDSAAGRSSAHFSPHHRELMSPSSADGAAALRDKESYDPRMPRPHQHKHGFHDPKLTKLPDRGSYSSLPDSGISDQEQQTKDRHRNDALANLPGPGKFKQMTRQRGADDVDSGFVGSVVGSEVLQNQSHDQAERPLRLQDRRIDQNPNRSFLNSSGSTSTIATSAGSSRRSSLKQDLPSKHSSTATGMVNRSVSHSTDQSYDGELDESTVSEVRAKVLQPRDVPTKERYSVNPLKLKLSESVPGHKSKGKDESVEKSQSVQESTFEDTKNEETDEDFSTSGPEESAARVYKSVEITTEQHIQATQHETASLRPSTPRRPPTPYQLEQSQENQVEDADKKRNGLQQQKMHPAKTLKSHVTSDNELHSMSKLRQMHRSQTPPVQMQQDQQRPQSRGEPTTDLYHTRGQRGHNNDETKVISEPVRRSSYEGRRENQRQDSRVEDVGISTDTDVRSDVTRGSSVNSSRLRALQEEIERLKEGVKQANEKASNPPQFPPPPPPPERQDPEYYDPFDDPYGFMRMPRRRANSFSGGRVRDYDEWYWTLPNERRNEDGDIPLGYAAADSFNRRAHGQRDTHEAPHRLKHRVPRRRASYMQPKTVDSGGGVDGEAAPGMTSEPTAQGAQGAQSAAPSQTSRSMPLRGHPPPPHITDPQALFNYYVPTRNNIQPAYMPSATKTNHTVPPSSSQTNMADVHASAVTYQPQRRASDSQQSLRKEPWYTIRRAPRHLSGGEYVPVYSHQPPRPEYQQAATSQSYMAPNTYYAAYPVVGGVATTHGNVGHSYWTEVCPLCGGPGGHIHEEDVEPVYGYAADDFATEGMRYKRRWRQYRGRTRQRSKSRSQRYTPERSSSQNQYLVREYREAASDDSDLEEATFHRRNRSKSRSRSHSETRSSSRHRHSRRYRRRRDQSPELLDSDENVDLNESLVLSEDISRLTKRMLGTVHGELVKSRSKPDFGSSYW